MGNVFRTVHRIRKAEERLARVQLAEDQRAVEGCQDALRRLESDLDASHTRAGSASNVIELAHHHSDALRMEMRRRKQMIELNKRHRSVSESNQRVHRVALRAKVVELVADAQAQLVSDELHHKDQIAMDEQGLQSWWRRSA